jgi:hypothetical protein
MSCNFNSRLASWVVRRHNYDGLTIGLKAGVDRNMPTSIAAS